MEVPSGPLDTSAPPHHTTERGVLELRRISRPTESHSIAVPSSFLKSDLCVPELRHVFPSVPANEAHERRSAQRTQATAGAVLATRFAVPLSPSSVQERQDPPYGTLQLRERRIRGGLRYGNSR